MCKVEREKNSKIAKEEFLETRKKEENKKYHFPLRSCVWEITLKCCFACQYCGSKAGKARKNELTTEECLNVVKQLSDMGCERVSLIGGEVFLRTDWYTIVKALTDRKIKVAVITNGFCFTDELIAEIKKSGIESIAISIDGPEKIHDTYRQKGSFQKAMKAMESFISNEIPVSVISTLHSKNISYLDEMYDILKNRKIFAWQLQACSPMGNAIENELLTKIDFRKVIRFVEKHYTDSDFTIGVADNIGYYTETEGYIRGNRNGTGYFMGCQAGLTCIGIDSVGNVRGCESMYDEKFIEGNLREKSLYTIWNDSNAFAYNRQFTLEQLSGSCSRCSNKKHCAGGCRSYNYFTTGKLYESLYCAHF